MSFQISKSSKAKSFKTAKILKMPTLNTMDASPALGTIAYDSNTDRLYYGNGTNWILIQTGTI
jgi:hypothetical protein